MTEPLEERLHALVQRILVESSDTDSASVVRLRSLALALPGGAQIDLQEKARKMNPPFLASSETVPH